MPPRPRTKFVTKSVTKFVMKFVMKSLLLSALACLLAAPQARADYRQKAQEQTAFIQTHYYDAAARKYRDGYPVDPKALPWTLMWANGVQFRVMVEAARDDPARYRPVLSDYGQGLREYWDPQPKGSPPGFNAYCSGPGGDDKYYDDNAWMVLGYTEAYDLTHDPQYLAWAEQTQAFVLSGWDDTLGGGIYWSLKHDGKPTCVSAPDAVAAARLAARGDAAQADWGPRLTRWVDGRLAAPDGLYWDNVNLGGKIEKTKWTYNTGQMIEAKVLQFQARGDRKALADAERRADAALIYWQDPRTGAFADSAGFTHLLCEGLLRLYDADHDVRYLNAVRRHAAFGYHHARDAQGGGYWDDWRKPAHAADERKSLLEQASDARLFWLLAPYPDVDQLAARGYGAAAAGREAEARRLLSQAADSDTEAVEPRFHLWEMLLRDGLTAEARTQQKLLIAQSAGPALRARLVVLGWTPPAPAAGQ